MRTLLVPTAASPYRRPMLQYVCHLAQLLDAGLKLVVLADPEIDGNVRPEAVAASGSRSSEELASRLDRIPQEVREDFLAAGCDQVTEVRVSVQLGEATEGYLKELMTCDFGLVGRALFGEIGPRTAWSPRVERILSGATKPLFLVPDHYVPIRHALVAVGGGVETGHALEFLCSLPKEAIRITLLTVAPPGARQDILVSLMSRYCEEHGRACDARSAFGDPTTELIDAARELQADLLVLGGSHRSGFAQFLAPDYAREVLQAVPMPALIWR